MAHLSKNKNITNALSLSLAWLVMAFLLSGCGTVLNEGTPVIEKHAKRGYNKPYQINGTWYYPQGYYEYSEVGKASYYGGRDKCHGRKTSTGEHFDMHGLTAAMKTLPLPSVVLVTNLENGRSLKLKVIDRGPFVDGRIIDVSCKAAKLLGFYNKGVTDVRVEALVAESLQLAKGYNPNASRLAKKKSGKQPKIPLRKNQEPAPILTVQKDAKPSTAKPLLATYQQSSKRQNLIRPVSATQQPVRLSGVFVQMGVFTSPERAQKLTRLTNQRYRVPVKTYRYNKANQPTYRVLMGPFNSSENAKNLLKQVRSQGYRNAVVVHE